MNPEMQKIIDTLRENNPGKYNTYTDQDLAENFFSIIGTGFDDSFNIDQANLGADYYTDEIEEDSKFSNPLFKTFQNVKSNISDFTAPAVGGLISLATGIPGVGLLLSAFNRFRQPNVPNPMAQGVYKDPNTGFLKDKFGYNVGPTLFKSNFLQPGSSSYRSYALQGLRSLDKNLADNFYQTNYGKSFDEVKKEIQKKEDPFGSAGVIDMGADYQGGNNDNQSFNEGPVGNNAGGAQLGSGMSTGQHAAFRMARGGIASL